MSEQRPVIFLDFDGVLNSDTWWLQQGGAVPDKAFDPACVARLNALVVEADAVIVLSTAWRHASLVNNREMVAKVGLDPERVIGQTPSYLHRRENGLTANSTRGDEIAAWLQRNPKPAHFCILDDGDDMAPYLAHLVQTASEYGLTDADVARARVLLGMEPRP